MVPAKKPELTQRHKDVRLAFSRAHALSAAPLSLSAAPMRPQWRRVIFSDESRLYLRRVDGRKRVIPRVAYQGGGVMVWAGISATPHVLPFLRQMPVADLIFLDDNAIAHRRD